MICLTADQIYLYLEGELSFKEAKQVSSHIDSCSQCKSAFEERLALHQASSSLHSLTPPPDFVQSTMALVPVDKESIWSPLLAISVGFSSAALIVFSYLLITGQNLASFFIGLSHTLLGTVRTVSVGAVKAVKLISILFKAVWQIGSFLISGLGRFQNIISTELQVGLILAACMFFIILYLGIRKKLFFGERA
ncbi:anti-sigma factor family protein [Acidobacteriota bacterium]